MQLCNKMSAISTFLQFYHPNVFYFYFSYNYDLDEGPGHQNWHQNVELSGLHHHTKFERNWSVNVWIQANIKGFFVVFFNNEIMKWVLSLEY